MSPVLLELGSYPSVGVGWDDGGDVEVAVGFGFVGVLVGVGEPGLVGLFTCGVGDVGGEIGCMAHGGPPCRPPGGQGGYGVAVGIGVGVACCATGASGFDPGLVGECQRGTPCMAEKPRMPVASVIARVFFMV